MSSKNCVARSFMRAGEACPLTGTLVGWHFCYFCTLSAVVCLSSLPV